MKLLITGLNGTLGPRVADAAGRAGFQITGWNRDRVNADDADAATRWLQAERPAAIVHLALGSEGWAGRLARHAHEHRIPFLFSSSAMVFHHDPDGPHRIGNERTARDDYGRYKIRCEDTIRSANADAMIVRIGWQIGSVPVGNNMLRALDDWQAQEGHVQASRRWTPACSFVDQTAAAFVRLLRAPRPGTFHFDSNARGAYSFVQVVRALQATFGRTGWQIREHDDDVHDQRLLGDELDPPDLADALPALRDTSHHG
jgi:dTDP-4-dehydrorhamnose reductase